ncbi:tetratricopeptide repeat protein [Paragemmobacter straminiformis]|nr:tetratricopeptide repeat protein [Gemmobacter straminiformis]
MPFHNRLVAAVLAVFALAWPVFADDAALDKLFDELKTSDAQASGRIEQEIWNEWSKSGSPAMDLLLERGRKAMAEGDLPAAIEHLTALTDHAPDFAEGWNARATAYYQMGELGPAVQDIAHVLTLNPRHFGALAGLGMIFEQLDQPKKALEVYKAALAIHPHLSGVLDSVQRLEAEAAGQDL